MTRSLHVKRVHVLILTSCLSFSVADRLRGFNLWLCEWERYGRGGSGLEAPKIFGLRFEDESRHWNSSSVWSGALSLSSSVSSEDANRPRALNHKVLTWFAKQGRRRRETLLSPVCLFWIYCHFCYITKVGGKLTLFDAFWCWLMKDNREKTEVWLAWSLFQIFSNRMKKKKLAQRLHFLTYN